MKIHTLKAVLYQAGYLFVGTKTLSKDYEGQYYLDGKIFHTDKVMLQSGCVIIVAQSPELSIPGVPYVELEENAEQLAGNHFPMEMTGGGISKSDRQLQQNAFIKGYKAAQAKSYTEEDVVKLMRWTAEMTIGMRDSNNTHSEVFEQIDKKAQSLQPKIWSIELETQWVKDFAKGEGFGGAGSIDIEEPVTYQKDGKTFLKVKQINYARTT